MKVEGEADDSRRNNSQSPILNSQFKLPPYRLWESRTGSGTPLALIHGLSGSTRWWSRNIPELAEKHLVAAVDLIGFGRNHRLTTPLLMPAFQEVTALLARWLEMFPEPVHLAGHSMGGLLAIRLAAERPDLVRSLVLVNAVGMPFALRPGPHLRALPKRPWGLNLAPVLIPDAWRAGPTSLAVASARVLRGDSREWMRHIRVPTLLVWGAADPLVPVPYAEEMNKMLAGSRLVVLENAAHVAMWDQPAKFNRLVLDFLDEVEKQNLPATPSSALFAWGIAGWTEGVAHRQAGRRRDIILVHGLGMASAYFEPFARALFELGWNPIAPDLRGFGESDNAAGRGPDAHAADLAAWADTLGIRDAVWVGHSLGCNVIAQLARLRPDLCRETIHIGPLWTRHPLPVFRLFTMLTLDAFREPLRLYRFVIPSYWRAGLWRWATSLWRSRWELRTETGRGMMIAGVRDPLPDRNTLNVVEVAGAHACHFSHPIETAGAVGAPR